MRRASLLLTLALLLGPATSGAAPFSVEVWTDRGNDAVFKPGERMTVKVRTSDDANLLVYEIDAEGHVNVLFPDRTGAGFVEGRRTYQLPPDDANVELVVQEPVGQCYLVAIASMNPFQELPWYLRPYNAQAEEVGYVGEPPAEEGVTAEGRIVGDPFVAMERIRRRVLINAENAETFATSYTSYYVHQAVRYPRYLCYDCHRPNQWSWWDGFDPYYTSCSVFHMRVNWSWYWGPRYWYGYVPYFVYVYRPDCPPRYYSYYQNGGWCSSWDGWTSWTNLWGAGTLRRFKSPAPAGYTPPSKFGPGNKWKPGAPTPPGFLAGNIRSGRGASPFMPVGRNGEVRGGEGGLTRTERGAPIVGAPRQESPGRAPARDENPDPFVRNPRDEGAAPGVTRREERVAPPSPPARREPEPRYTPRGEAPAPAEQSRESAPKYVPGGRARPSPAGRPSRSESQSWFAPRQNRQSAPPPGRVAANDNPPSAPAQSVSRPAQPQPQPRVQAPSQSGRFGGGGTVSGGGRMSGGGRAAGGRSSRGGS